MSDFIIDGLGPYIVVAPGDFRDYSLDWTNFLAALPGLPVDQIKTSTWSVPTPNVASLPTANIPTNVTTTWISTPTVGTYVVVNTIITTGGRDFSRSFRLIVAENI
jgi:hypothetical protein